MYRRISLNQYAKVLLVAILATTVLWLFGGSLYAQAPADILSRAKRLHQTGVKMEAVIQYEAYLKQVPTDLDTRLTLIALLNEMKRELETKPHIDYCVKHHPNDPRVRPYVEIAQAQRAQAIRSRYQELEALVSVPNPQPNHILEYARHFAQTKQYARAVKQYERYLQIMPKDNKARYELAQQHAWNKNYPVALRLIATILANNSNDVQARVLWGNILFWQGDEEGAMEQYSIASKLSPKDASILKQIKQIESQPGYREKMLTKAVQKDSIGVALTDLAAYFLEVNREWEAEALVKRRLAISPNDKDAQKIQAEIEQRRTERFNKNVQASLDRLEKNPRDTTALLLMARINSQSGDFQASLEFYNRYKDLFPMDYKTRLERANVLLWSGNAREAADEYRIINVALPDNRQSRLGLGEALIQINTDIEEAEQIFAQDVKENPTDLLSRLRYAYAIRRLGKYPEAKQIYKEILAVDSANQEAKEGLRIMDQDFGPLIRDIELKVAADPTNKALQMRLAGMLFDAKRYFEAEKLVTQMIAEDQKNKRLQSFLEQIVQRKKIYQAEQLAQARIKVLDRPDSLELRIRYAELLAAEGFGKEAVAQYRLILEQRPNQPDLTQKAADLLLNNKQLKEAIELYGNLADQYPTVFQYRYRLALILSWAGDNDQAIIEFESALRLNPSSVEGQIGLANAYKWKGDIYTAWDIFRRLLALYPNNIEARNALEDMDGSFFRGMDASISDAVDNETFHLTEGGVNAIVGISLKMIIKAGFGSFQLSQSDRTKLYPFSEVGYFGQGRVDYYFDQHTRGGFGVKYYVFADYKTPSYWLDIQHTFIEGSGLEGVEGSLRYSSQLAVFDLASTHSLQTFTDKLTSDRFTAWAKYTNQIRPWFLEGSFDYFAVSDANGRTDLVLSAGYWFQKWLSVGPRYEQISASKEVKQYWSPDKYETVSGWVGVQNSSSRWTVSATAGFGRVLHTDNTVRRASGQASYRINNQFSIAASFLALATARQDGEYWYRGLNGSLVWNY